MGTIGIWSWPTKDLCKISTVESRSSVPADLCFGVRNCVDSGPLWIRREVESNDGEAVRSPSVLQAKWRTEVLDVISENTSFSREIVLAN